MMDNWAEAVVHPLGIAGFSLFLIFLILTRFRGTSVLSRTLFISLAVVCLGAGLWLAVEDSKAIKTRGDKSPIVTNTGGPVEINISDGK